MLIFFNLHKLISDCTLFQQSKTKLIFGNLQNYVCNPIYCSFQSIRIPFNCFARWGKADFSLQNGRAKIKEEPERITRASYCDRYMAVCKLYVACYTHMGLRSFNEPNVCNIIGGGLKVVGGLCVKHSGESGLPTVSGKGSVSWPLEYRWREDRLTLVPFRDY